MAGAARDWLTRFLHERVPTSLGAPLATLPRFQSAVGEIETALFGADTLVDTLAARVDSGDRTAAEQAGAVKVLATRAAITAVEQAVALTGNHGLTRANPLQRHYRDVLCSRVHTPQDDSVLLTTGREALGRVHETRAHDPRAQDPRAQDPGPSDRGTADSGPSDHPAPDHRSHDRRSAPKGN